MLFRSMSGYGCFTTGPSAGVLSCRKDAPLRHVRSLAFDATLDTGDHQRRYLAHVVGEISRRSPHALVSVGARVLRFECAPRASRPGIPGLR